MPNSPFKRRDLPEILPVGRGGTGTNNGSINGADDIVLTPAVNKVIKMNSDTLFLGNLLPDLTDSRSIGSSTLFFKDQFVSQINATIFAENTISLLGGWFVVGKNQVKLPAITSVQTQIDFGTLMYPGDFIIVRAHDASGTIKAEYMQIGTLVSGTTYNVTRDIANMHVTDPIWADGTPALVLGTTGDGRIELNAYDSPRISIIQQGPTYNAQTEVIRLGDLNGIGGISSQKFGIYVGTANNHMQYNSTDDSLIVTGTIKATSGYIGGTSTGWAIGSNILSGGTGNTYIALDQGNSKIRIGAKATLTDANTGVHLGSDGLALGANSVFTVTSAGALTATSATITGSITATSGSIGGFTIATNLTTGTKAAYNDANSGIFIGSTGIGLGPASTGFYVSAAGALTATGATISGSITASSGTIGGFTVNSTEGLYSGSGATRVQMKSGAGFWAGADARDSAPFRVTEAGALTATSATITGVINANTGYLGGATNYWSIGAGLLTSVGTASLVMATASSTIKVGSATTIDAGAGIFMDGNGNFRAGTATTGSDFIKATTSTLTIKSSTFDLSTTTLKITSAPSIALGSTPPTSATSGTGIWMNAAGIYGLNANTQNFILSAADGSITAISGAIGGWTLNSNYLRATNGGTYGTNLVNIMLNKVTHGTDSALASPGGLMGFHITGYESTSSPTGFRVGMGKIGSGHFYQTSELADYYGIEGLYSTNSGSWATSVMFRLAFRVTDGAIDAQIAGWKFDSSKLYNAGASGTYTGLQSSAAGTTKAFFTGATAADGTSAKAYINVDGSGALSNGAIAWDNAGNITAINKITAGSGTIGNWNITASSIQTGAFDTVSTMYFGTSGISLSNTFKVTAAGALTATGVTVSGTVNASAGNFTSTVTIGNGATSGTLTVGTNATATNRITIVGTDTAATTKIYAGAGTYNSTDTGFYMDASGRFSLEDKLTWDGTTLTINGGGTFSGALSAASGSFAGSLSAVTGTLGALTVNGTLTLGTGGIASTNFNVTSTGVVTATSATITGTINATGGYFGTSSNGWNISSNTITANGTGLFQTSASANTGIKINSTAIAGYNGTVQTVNIGTDGSGWFGLTGTRAISWNTSGAVTIAGWAATATQIYSGSTYLTNSSTLWSNQSSRLPTVYTHNFGSSNNSYVGTGSTGSEAIHTGTSPDQYWQLKTDNGDIETSVVTSPALTVTAGTKYVFEYRLTTVINPNSVLRIDILNSSNTVLYTTTSNVPASITNALYQVIYVPSITSIKIRFTLFTSGEVSEIRLNSVIVKTVDPFVELSNQGLFIYTDPITYTKFSSTFIDISSIKNSFYFNSASINAAYDYVNFGIKTTNDAYNEPYDIDPNNKTYPLMTLLGNGVAGTYAAMRLFSPDSSLGHSVLILERANKNRLSAIIHKNGVSQLNTQWVVGTGLNNSGNDSPGWGVAQGVSLSDARLFVNGGTGANKGYIGLNHTAPSNRLTLYGGTTAAEGIGFSTGSATAAADTVLYRGAAGQLVLQGENADLVLNSPTSTTRSNITFKDNGVAKAYLGVAYQSSAFIAGSSDGDFCMQIPSGKKMMFSADSGVSSALEIDSSGVSKATGLCRFRGSNLSSPPSNQMGGDIYIDDAGRVYIYDEALTNWTQLT